MGQFVSRWSTFVGNATQKMKLSKEIPFDAESVDTGNIYIQKHEQRGWRVRKNQKGSNFLACCTMSPSIGRHKLPPQFWSERADILHTDSLIPCHKCSEQIFEILSGGWDTTVFPSLGWSITNKQTNFLIHILPIGRKKTLIYRPPDQISKISLAHFFARDKAVWIKKFKLSSIKTGRYFLVKDGRP